MTEYIMLGTAVFAPVLLALFLRVHATHIFTAIVSGWLLSQYLSPTIELVISMSFNIDNSDDAAQIGLLVVPLVITYVLLRKSMKRSLLLQIIPLLASGLLFAALLLELAPQPYQANIYSSQLGDYLRQSSDLIIAVSTLLNLLVMWLVFRHKAGKEDKGKHHK